MDYRSGLLYLVPIALIFFVVVLQVVLASSVLDRGSARRKRVAMVAGLTCAFIGNSLLT